MFESTIRRSFNRSSGHISAATPESRYPLQQRRPDASSVNSIKDEHGLAIVDHLPETGEIYKASGPSASPQDA
jgi:hypothetical protein